MEEEPELDMGEARRRLALSPLVYVVAYNRREYLEWCFEHRYDYYKRSEYVYIHGAPWLRKYATDDARRYHYMLTPRATGRQDWPAIETELARLNAERIHPGGAEFPAHPGHDARGVGVWWCRLCRQYCAPESPCDECQETATYGFRIERGPVDPDTEAIVAEATNYRPGDPPGPAMRELIAHDKEVAAMSDATYPVQVRRRSLSEMLDYLAQDVTDHAPRYTPATLMVLFSTMADQARELELKVAAIDDVERSDG